MGPAIRDEDFVWARLDAYKRRVDAALSAIQEAAKIGPIGVSFSGGKDSTVTLHLVRQIVPDAPAALFDSGDELADTYEMARQVGAEIIPARITMREMARYSGWWGYEKPVDPGCPFDAKRILIGEPSETFVVKRGLRVIAYGLRAEESGGRQLHVRARGMLFEGSDRTWYCMPLAKWKLQDVWAYIAEHGLRYHAAYDAMSAARIPREDQRVSGLLGGRGTGAGRYALLRRFAPKQWEELVAEFPGLRLMS